MYGGAVVMGLCFPFNCVKIHMLLYQRDNPGKEPSVASSEHIQLFLRPTTWRRCINTAGVIIILTSQYWHWVQYFDDRKKLEKVSCVDYVGIFVKFLPFEFCSHYLANKANNWPKNWRRHRIIWGKDQERENICFKKEKNSLLPPPFSFALWTKYFRSPKL